MQRIEAQRPLNRTSTSQPVMVTLTRGIGTHVVLVYLCNTHISSYHDHSEWSTSFTNICLEKCQGIFHQVDFRPTINSLVLSLFLPEIGQQECGLDVRTALRSGNSCARRAPVPHGPAAFWRVLNKSAAWLCSLGKLWRNTCATGRLEPVPLAKLCRRLGCPV